MSETGERPGERKTRKDKRPDSVRGRRELEHQEMDKLREEARSRVLKRAQLKLTEELLAQIVAGVRDGNYPSVVARAVGVPTTAYNQWIEAGKESFMRGEYATEQDPLGLRVELYLLTEQADAEWEVDTVAQMKGHIEKGTYWAGHMTMLQRRHPERWDTRGRSTGTEDKSIEQRIREWEAEERQRQANADVQHAPE